MVIRFPYLPPAPYPDLCFSCHCSWMLSLKWPCSGTIPALSATTSFFFLSGGGTLCRKRGVFSKPSVSEETWGQPLHLSHVFQNLSPLFVPSVCYFPSLFSLRFVFFALSHTVFTASVSSLSPFMPLQFGIRPLGYTEICT